MLYCPPCRQFKLKESQLKSRQKNIDLIRKKGREAKRRARRDPRAGELIRQTDRARGRAAIALSHRYQDEYLKKYREEFQRVNSETLLVVETVAEHYRYVYSQPLRSSHPIALEPLEPPTVTPRSPTKSERKQATDRRHAKARGRALRWLQREYKDEFDRLYDEYLEEEIIRVPIGTRVVPEYDRGVYGYPID